MCVTALGNNFPDALKRSYNAIDRLCFEGIQFRKDIGAWILPTVRIAVLGSTRGTDLQAIIGMQSTKASIDKNRCHQSSYYQREDHDRYI